MLMNTLQKIDHWSATHQSVWLDYLRVALGLFILAKGIMFITDLEGLNKIITNSRFEFIAIGLMHYVVFAHLTGGILIALGLLTRFAVLCQLPVLLGAVIFVNAEKGFFSAQSELGISIVTLVLLLFFLVYGSGKFSADTYMNRAKEKRSKES